MIFMFCQEYMDEETYNVVSNFKQIALHYAKSVFIFDFIAWLPISLFIQEGDKAYQLKLRLLRILRLLRLPRLA